MQKPCQDSYYTLFSSYPMLLDYHEEQAKNSRWIRCKVADLQVEPLGESSPLIGNLSAFATGTSQEAVKDTAENLGLAMRVNGELYPVRMTAYKSLLDRAKIGGTALPKLSREVLAEVLKAFMELPLKRRQVMELLFLADLSEAETAKRLNCSLQYVRNQRCIALKKLRSRLMEGGDDE